MGQRKNRAHIHQMPGLRFLGVMGWEGHAVPLEGEHKQSEIAAAMARLTDSAEACRAAGLTVGIVSASGSATYLLSAPRPGLTEVQAGGGAFCDSSAAAAKPQAASVAMAYSAVAMPASPPRRRPARRHRRRGRDGCGSDRVDM